jgi:hypothetical protein
MKPIILAALLATCFPTAFAGGDPHICSLVGSVYETAASARDMKMPPEKALDMVSAYSEVPLEGRKKIINEVYFDQGFVYAGGTPLRYQMMDLCMNGPKNWKPLK